MNGPEHYAEAERLLVEVAKGTGDRGLDAEGIAAAHAHATLALAAAAQDRAGYVVTSDDVMRCAHGAVICGLCGYGVNAGDGGRS